MDVALVDRCAECHRHDKIIRVAGPGEISVDPHLLLFRLSRVETVGCVGVKPDGSSGALRLHLHNLVPAVDLSIHSERERIEIDP
jgi:hypothetical protein